MRTITHPWPGVIALIALITVAAPPASALYKVGEPGSDPAAKLKLLYVSENANINRTIRLILS